METEGEIVTTLLAMPAFRIVRIVSHGDRTPDGWWYDQDEHEWVMVVTGEGEVEIEGQGVTRLGPGDALLLPCRTRHRVSRTSPEVPTVWLAVHFTGELVPELAAEAVARIVGHMNEDHGDALLDYARHQGRLPEAGSARMVEVDATGFTLDTTTSDGSRQLRLPFDPPVTDATSAREALVAMAREARERLGG